MSASNQSSKQECKVFVGGLSWETNDQKLRMYFENYGNVTEAFVNYDRNTGRPRGFGFVVFDDPTVADRVVLQPHTIDRREVEAKKAVPKEEHQAKKQTSESGTQRSKKIFVGGLAPTVDEKAFREYFEQYGSVKDAVVMYDHENKRPRGFGFVTFQDDDAVAKVFANGVMQTLHDKKIEIKHAVPRDQMAVTRSPVGLPQRAFVGPSPEYVYPQSFAGVTPAGYTSGNRGYQKFPSTGRMNPAVLSGMPNTYRTVGGGNTRLGGSGTMPLGLESGGAFAGYGTGLHGGYGNMLFSNATANGLGSTFPNMNGYPPASLNELGSGNSPTGMAHTLPVGQMGTTAVKNFGSFSGHSPGSGYGGFSPGGHIDSVASLNAGVVGEGADIDAHGLPLGTSVKQEYHPVYDGTTFSDAPNPGWSN